MCWFISNYLPFDPDLFLHERLPQLEKLELEKVELIGSQSQLSNSG